MQRPLRVATFLAPNLLPLYRFLARRLGERLGRPAELVEGTSYEQLFDEVDVGFVCGLAYVELAPPVEPVAAPVPCGPRYGGRPVYFSDVVVRRDGPLCSFADLRGRSWAFNEVYSQSGYGVTRHRLVELGETRGYFGRVVEAGWHERSLELVCAGAVDASAIDSHVLAVALRDRPGLAGRLRVIDSFGPSTVQPVVVARRLPGEMKIEVRQTLVGLHEGLAAREHLDRGLVQRFVPVTDADYDDIRRMRAACAAADFLTLR